MAPRDAYFGPPEYVWALARRATGRDLSAIRLSLAKGDRLLIYTDGLIEATNPHGQEFGQAGLCDFINTHEELSAEQFAGRLLQEILAWPGTGNSRTQADDITIVVIDFGRNQQPN